MRVLLDMSLLTEGTDYTREDLTKIWALGGPQALRRGIVTPAESDDILLFITEEKSGSQTAYEDRLMDDELIVESDGQPHSESRIEGLLAGVGAAYLFYRKRATSRFTYYGETTLRQVLSRAASGRAKYRFSVGAGGEALATSDETDQAIALELGGQEEGHGHDGGKTYTRSRSNRQSAIAAHGNSCTVCGFAFDDFYGADLADGYIQIHHLVPVAEGVRVPDPLTELAPVCPNCHAMLHRRRNRLVSIAELKSRLSRG